MKKIVCLFLLLLLAVIFGAGGYYYYQRIQPEENDENIWKTVRPLPDKIAVDAYLAGNIARKNHDIPRMLDAYAKVLHQDPNHTQLLKDFYVLSLFQGRARDTLPYLDKIPDSLREVLYSDYLKAAQLFLEESDQLVPYLNQKKYHKADSIILPLFFSWEAARRYDKQNALASLNRWRNDPQLVYVLGYQEFLLGTFFNDEELKENGFQKIQDKKLSALGYFPLLKQQAEKEKVWVETPLYQQFSKMEKVYSATTEFIQIFGQKEITPDKGLAEMFYFLSVEANYGLFSKEGALFLNSIALFLQPNKTLSQIWAAELLQSMDLPYMALTYYDKIPQKSATLKFKQAMLLILNDQKEQAQKIMESLEAGNAHYVPLLTLMGQNYFDLKQYPQALAIYNRLIPLLEQDSQNKPLAEAYIARSNVYRQTNQSELIMSDLQKAQILMPQDPMIQNDIGYRYLEMGQTDMGFDLIQQAYQSRPKDPYILDSMAFAYYKKNQPQKALHFAEEALNLRPQNALINMHLGDIYNAVGRVREAGFQYKKALDLQEDLTPQLQKQIQEKMQQLNPKD